MANCAVMLNNMPEVATAVAISGFTEDTSYPVANLLDWRPGRAFRTRFTGTVSGVEVIYTLPVAKGPTAAVIGGHNFKTADAYWLVKYSTVSAAGPWSDAFTIRLPPSDNAVELVVFPQVGPANYVNLALASGGASFLATPELGIFTLGEIWTFTVGTQPSLDPFGLSVETVDADLTGGHFLHPNPRFIRKTFRLEWDTPGWTPADLDHPTNDTQSFVDSFIPHAITAGKPFWFAWNYEVDPTEVYLCRVSDRQFSNPFDGSYKRRRLSMTFDGYREIA